MLLEDIALRHYVGNCVNSFDEDGDCTISELPFSTATDLGYVDESANRISKQEFLKRVKIPVELQSTINQCDEFIDASNLRYYQGLLIAYDSDEDIHYFFV